MAPPRPSFCAASLPQIILKGNGHRHLPFQAAGILANGDEAHHQRDGWGCGRSWRDNASDLGGSGRYPLLGRIPVVVATP